MSTMTVVWEKDGDYRLGAVSEDHFIAIWGEDDGTFHATFCVPPEWQSLADEIERIVERFKPIRPIWEWPELEPVEE